MENEIKTMFTDTIKYCDEVIFVKPVCDFFGIDYRNQVKRINADPILQTSVGKKNDMLLFGDERERVTLSKRGFLRWIQVINAQLVPVTLREKLYTYQNFIFDFIFGSVEREETAKVNYARLNKLKRLRSKISSEIAICQDEIHNYLEGRLIQSRLDF